MTTRMRRSRRGIRLGLQAVLLFGVTIATSSCSEPSSKLSKGIDPAEVTAANKVVDAMLKVYREADSYRDNASIEWDLERRQGRGRHERYQYSLEFARPNRMRLSYEPSGLPPIDVISDGSEVHAAPRYFFNQVVRFTAPDAIEAPAFYKTAELAGVFKPTVVCSLVSGSRERFASLPLDLLTGTEPLKQLRAADKTPRLDDPQTIGDERCDRVRYTVGRDDITLWIGQKTHLLHRVQIAPTHIDADSNAVQRISVDFRGVAINGPDDPRRFQWERTGKTILVKQLVSPTGDLKPSSPMLGREMPNYKFVRSDGSPGDIHSLQGKFAVIDLWATDCGFCGKAMPELNKVRERFAADNRVEFLAISLDNPGVPMQAIQRKMDEWAAGMPVARMVDTDPPTVFEQLQVPGMPTTIVVSPHGAIHYVHVGYDPTLEQTLPGVLESLLSYPDRLEEVRLADSLHSIALPQADLAEVSQPQHFTMEKLWTTDRVANPGNMVVVEESDQPSRIFVIDEPRSVVELTEQGKIKARHVDLVPEGQEITILRTATTSEGQRLFAVSGNGAPQMFVFDDDWQLKFAYPDEPGVGKTYDVAMGRFSPEGPLRILVGYYGPAGLHALSDAGERLWRNRFVENVGDLAVVTGQGEQPGYVLCANHTGTLLPFDAEGQMQTPWSYGDYAVPYVAVSPYEPSGTGPQSICGIRVDIHSNREAARLMPDRSLLWQLVLPVGEYKSSLDPFAFARLERGQAGYWAIAAADGSIHLMREDGQRQDRFAAGREITGMAASRIEGKSVILLSGQNGVTAWSFAAKAESE